MHVFLKTIIGKPSRTKKCLLDQQISEAVSRGSVSHEGKMKYNKGCLDLMVSLLFLSLDVFFLCVFQDE